MTPTCSIIMPAYQAERFIMSAIQSVINQTFQDWELIIIDDSSTDNTRKEIQAAMRSDNRIRLLINEKNLGVAETRNKGVQYAQGKWIAFLDSDDIFLPDKLEKQIKHAENNQASFVCSSYSLINEQGINLNTTFRVPPTITQRSLITHNVIGCSTVLMSNQLARQYPMESRFYHEDFACWLQCLEKHTCLGIGEPLVQYRLMQRSRSSQKWKSLWRVFFIYRKCLQLDFFHSLYYISIYALNGVTKYHRFFLKKI